MTNREKLNEMSNKELSELMGYTCQICPYHHATCNHYSDCAEGVMEWLESEVDE